MELELCLAGLQSGKVTERRKSVENLRQLIDTPTVIDTLNNSNDKQKNWETLYFVVNKCIKKETEKFYQNESKQKILTSTQSQDKNMLHSLLIAIVSQANSKNVRLSVTKLIESVLYCFGCDYQQKYFGDLYLTVLVKHVLPVRKYWGEISRNQWQEIYYCLKNLLEVDSSDADRPTILRGLYLIIKFGCNYSSLVFIIRNDFNFIEKLCTNLRSHHKFLAQQEITLQLLNSFCLQVSKECRMASCRLGENVLYSLMDLYESRYETFGSRKSLMFDFMLLQTRLHHPNGVTENADSAYAYNWTTWKAILRKMYTILCTEIDVIVRYNSSSSQLPTLWPNFLDLFVDVCKQVFNNNNINNDTLASQLTKNSEPVAKKSKLEVGLTAILYSLQSDDNWPWLCVLAELLTNYPEIIIPNNFVALLEILVSLQAECKNSITRHYLYNLLNVMVEVQQRLVDNNFDVEKMDLLWTRVWETSLRSVGLNQSEEMTHNVIQKMLLFKKTPQPLALLSIYTSNVLNMSHHSIQTLNVLCETVTLPELVSDVVIRKHLINFILGLNSEKSLNSTVFSERITAQVLMGLILKSWPYVNSALVNEIKNRKHKSIEDLYALSSFESKLLHNKTASKQLEGSNNSCFIHSDLRLELDISINTFCTRLCENPCRQPLEIIDFINSLILILHLLSELFMFEIVTEESLPGFLDLNKLFDHLYNALIDTNMNLHVLKQLEVLFSIEVSEPVSKLIRDEVSVEFLQIFFELLYTDTVDNTDDMDELSQTSNTELSENFSQFPNENALQNIEKLQLYSVHILSLYSCVPNANSLNQKQQQVLDTFAEHNFDANNNKNFQMCVYFLKCLTSCKPGTLPNAAIELIISTLQDLLEAKYKDYDAATLLLEILKATIPHIHNSGMDTLKNGCFFLLNPFYERKNSYGVNVSNCIINCIGDVLQIDPLKTWPDVDEMTNMLLEFLKSDYHEIRLNAIKNVLYLFIVNSDTTLEMLEKQKVVFSAVCVKILDSFSITNNLNGEQIIDETANRTVSALHAYASLIVLNPVWKKQSLYAMIQLISEKNLNINLVKKVLSIIKKHLDMNDFMESNVSYVVSQWTKQGRTLINFPFALFDSENLLEFSKQYVNVVIPIVLQGNDPELLRNVCKELNKSFEDVIKDSYSNIMAQFLPTFFHVENADQSGSTFLFKQLNEVIGAGHMSSLMIDRLDQIYMNLLNRTFDYAHFKEKFQFFQILPEPDPPFYTYEMFIATIKHIEEKLPSETQLIMKYFIKKHPQKLEHILLEATINLHKTSVYEDKLISLHRYSILIDDIIPELQTQNHMRTFLIRSITHNLMNLIKSSENINLSIAACRYFQIFCAQCLPNCTDIFNKLLVLIVSTLVAVAKLNTPLSTECITLLQFLIVDNSKHLYNSIGSMDPFPNDEKFAAIQEVYEKIKYGNDTLSLEQEIVYFLKAGCETEVGDRTEGLQHLRLQLSEKKMELSNLYEKLHELRGFYQNGDQSILHQLICMLVKLTGSPNKIVSLEAARCLGELGPADLTTLVLKPDAPLCEDHTSPVEFIASQVILLLSEYLVNSDVRVAKAASEALYVVAASKEGRTVAYYAKNNNFGCTFNIFNIFPFLSKSKSNAESQININEERFSSNINEPELWCPTFYCAHSDWIISLVSKLLGEFPKKCFLNALMLVCSVKMEFAEDLFPLIIYLLLCQNSKCVTEVLSQRIAHFFQNHWLGTSSNRVTSSQSTVNSTVMFNRASVQCMLNVVQFIRLRRSICKNKRSIDDLKLNYLHIAQGAQFCSAHFTTILYTELWCYDKLDETSSSQLTSTFNYISETEQPELTQAFENLLREAYKKIGDVDAMQGCGKSYILNPDSRVEHYKNLGRWDKVTLYYDSCLSNNQQTHSSDLVSALRNSSLHYLASNFKNDDFSTQYECAWRLGKWDLNIVFDQSVVNEYEKYHFIALKSLYERDNISMNQAIGEARKCVIQNLSYASLESSKNLYKALTELQLLQDIENFYDAQLSVKLPELLQKWKSQDCFTKNEFEYIEPIKAQRIRMLHNATNAQIILADFHLELANEARKEGFYHVAQRSLDSLSVIKNTTEEIKSRILFEQAQLTWLDDKTSGRYLLQHLLDNENTISRKLHASILKLYGDWMVETRSENPSSIIENYFEKALDILNDFQSNFNEIDNKCEAENSLARFADSQYQHVSNYIESSVFQSKVQTIKKFQDLATKICRQGLRTTDEKKAKLLYERQSVIDQTEVDNAYKEKNMYLNLAVQQYLNILKQTDTYNLQLFRILSLSLNNKSNTNVLEILKNTLSEIPSYKYIPLLPQLVPHIGTNQGEVFEEIIYNLLERCALDHPHHTLPVILGLANSYKDRDYDKSNNTDSIETRVEVAQMLVTYLKKKPSLSNIITNMELLSTALISLAYYETNKKRVPTIPKSEPIKNLRNLENILLPTINLEVRKNCDYSNIIGIREFGNEFGFVGGVNVPKRITCVGTDGLERTQLIKGKDDLRQDAVMQQVFSIMNTLLAKNKQTSKLLVRTYKVVPLSQRSGIIEWCENTEPLGDYLNEAHKRYHPSDRSPSQCRSALKNVHSENHSTKYRVYKEVCENFRPVFHMFFISSYPQPTIWFQRRKAYMHSVATSSMVGYILGLGDRHVQNILLDKNTAEVVHIDFGIAFEQGRVLPTPETVPFRLSRDIEDGMGICGIEGVFRRSCEKTMHVLRHNAETVLTILEVLLYDPLYAWTITPAEAYSRQKDEDIQQSLSFSDEEPPSVNVTAERALLRLKQKLQGTENGGVCSVEGQVELLLQQARDPKNLSRLYHGWQPYL